MLMQYILLPFSSILIPNQIYSHILFLSFYLTIPIHLIRSLFFVIGFNVKVQLFYLILFFVYLFLVMDRIVLIPKH